MRYTKPVSWIANRSFLQETNGSARSDKLQCISLRKIKGDATQPNEYQSLVASHFNLPNRTKTVLRSETSTKNFIFENISLQQAFSKKQKRKN